MLALARAIVSTPKILLVDEPSLGLSPRMVREAYRVLNGFKTRGMAILLVEQNVHAALRFANRATCFGRVRLYGRVMPTR